MKTLRKVNEMLENPDADALEMSLDNVHSEGLFSLVLGGTEHGKLTRVFVANKKLKPFGVQLHTHRYSIKLTVIKGHVKHYTTTDCESINHESVVLPQYKYKSVLNGGFGIRYMKDRVVQVKEFTIPVGATVHMNSDQFHTVSCSKGSMWIVEEQGFEKDHSLLLGVPFTVNDLYTKPRGSQVMDMFNAVHAVVKNLLSDFNTVSK